jgi:hypothetical protein
LARRRLHRRLHPGQEAGLERRRIEGGEDPAEGVMGGNAVGQVQELPEERLLAAPERLNGHPAVGPRDHGANGDGHDVEQGVALGALDPRIGQRGKMRLQRAAGAGDHRGTPHS